jgi:hypothetical protein
MTRMTGTSWRRPQVGPTPKQGHTVAIRPVIDLLPASRGSPPPRLGRAVRPPGAQQRYTSDKQASASAFTKSGSLDKARCRRVLIPSIASDCEHTLPPKAAPWTHQPVIYWSKMNTLWR